MVASGVGGSSSLSGCSISSDLAVCDSVSRGVDTRAGVWEDEAGGVGEGDRVGCEVVMGVGALLVSRVEGAEAGAGAGAALGGAETGAEDEETCCVSRLITLG